MTICKCGNIIPNTININGKRHNLSSRRQCLECLPFGQKPKWKPSARWARTPELIGQCNSLSDLILAVGLSNRGNSDVTAKKVIKYYNLDISHFNRYRSGRPHVRKYRNLDEIFCTNSKTHPGTIRWLYREFTEYKCTECGCNSWNNKPITLQIDHKNGDRTDNRVENLRYLCPNCHSQTENWGRKTKDYDPIIIQRQQKLCPTCKCILNKNTTYCSPECAFQSKRKVNRPLKEELLELVKTNSFRKISKNFNVSDRTIRKWCDYYNLNIEKSYGGKTLIHD